MSKQNGGEGGIIINMSSLAGKDNYHVNNDFLLVIGTTKVTLQSVFIINSGLKLKLGLLFFFLLVLWNFLLYDIRSSNSKFIPIILNCDFLFLQYYFKKMYRYFPRVAICQRLL